MQDEKYLFEEAPVPRAVMSLAVPTVITQLINIVYNFADTWYVGRTGNEAMVAALAVCFPIFVVMAAVANLFGVGGASVISRSLGRGDRVVARRVFAFCLWGGFLASVIYGLLILIFRDSLIMLIGGDVNSFEYASEYMLVTCVFGAIPTVGNVLCGHLVRSKGNAREAGIGMSLGGILNIVLDPLFMFVILPAGQETLGAAIATMLSNCASLLYFVIFLLRRRSDDVFTMNPKDCRAPLSAVKDVFLVGLPASLQTLFAMVSNVFANALIVKYGTGAVSGMGVAKKINMIAFNTCMGLTQGVLPLIGYTFGSGNYSRMRKVIKFTGTVTFVFGALCTVLFRAFSTPLVRFFIDETDSVMYGTRFLDIIAFAAPLAALTYMFNVVFQATGRKAAAFILAVGRKGLVDVPLMILFESLIGVYGVTWATPAAEIISAVLAVALFVRFLKSTAPKSE